MAHKLSGQVGLQKSVTYGKIDWFGGENKWIIVIGRMIILKPQIY